MGKIESNEDYKIILDEFSSELENLVNSSVSHKEALKFISSEFADEKGISSLEISLSVNYKFHINNNEPNNEFAYPIEVTRSYQTESHGR